MTSIQVSIELYCSPETVFDAYLDGARQTRITSSPAVVDPRVGGQMSLYSGAVTGQFVHLKRPNLIVQTWRTHDFEDQEPDSRLEMQILPAPSGARVVITQDHIPQRLRQQMINGWTSAYFPDLKAWTTEH